MHDKFKCISCCIFCMVENNENYSKILKKVPFPSCAREGHVRLMKKNEEKSLTTIIVNFDKTQPGVNFIKALTPAFFYWCKNTFHMVNSVTCIFIVKILALRLLWIWAMETPWIFWHFVVQILVFCLYEIDPWYLFHQCLQYFILKQQWLIWLKIFWS